jgi:hypothetical protein
MTYSETLLTLPLTAAEVNEWAKTHGPFVLGQLWRQRASPNTLLRAQQKFADALYRELPQGSQVAADISALGAMLEDCQPDVISRKYRVTPKAYFTGTHSLTVPLWQALQKGAVTIEDVFHDTPQVLWANILRYVDQQ